MLSLLTKALAVLSAVTAVHGFANPGSCSGACNVHDPAVIKRSSDGTYFRFSTGNKITIAKATSLGGPWTNQGSALPSGSIINLAGNQDLWAPDISKVGSTYYLYYAVSTFGSQNSAIGVATSTTMEVGSWTDHGQVAASTTGASYNAIDPNLIALASGGYQMQFGSFWHDLYAVPLASSLLTTNGNSVNLAYNSTGTHAEEGSYMFYHSGYYYLLFSRGSCCGYDTSRPAAGEEYSINVCRSTSSTSGFVDKSGKACTSGGGTTVLASHDKVYGPGGQGVFTDPTLGDVLYYHYVDTSIGYADGQKLFGYNTINWSSGWPVV